MNTEHESLKNELASKSSLAQVHQAEMNSLKASLEDFDETKSNLNKEIETMRKDIADLKTQNQQLKMLARKYKTQCEAVPREDPTVYSANLLAERDEKIKELEAKLAEVENLKTEIARLAKENEEIRLQSNEIDQKAKKIAQQAGQKLSEFKQVINSQKLEIVRLRKDDGNQPSTSKAKSNKMPISSTFISASLSSTSSFDPSVLSNIQPSSSNEDNVTQSAQITSHSISDDNSSELFSSQIADSNVTSNKRGYSSDSDTGMKKIRINDPEQIYQEESSNLSVINVDDEESSESPQGNEETNEESVESADNAPMDDGANEDQNADQMPDGPSDTASSCN